MKIVSLLPIMAGALLLAACASVPHLGPKPEPRAPQSLASAQSLAAPATAWPDADWWSAYRDPQLSRLIDEALAGSPTLAAAMARVRAAQAIAEAMPGSPHLSGSLDAQAGITELSKNQGIPPEFVPPLSTSGKISLSLNFDPDLWGRNRAALAAATSEAKAAEVDAEAARLLLTTNVASAYADLEAAFVARDLAGEALGIRDDSLALVRKRVSAQLEAPALADQSAAAERAARAAVTQADEQIALSRNRIAALLGAGPDRGLALTRPDIKAVHPLGAPAELALDLIGRRPDIVSARLRAEAAASRIKAARASFYPNINLAAVVGLQALGIEKLFSPDSTFIEAGPAISLPIFNQGALAGHYREARAHYDEAVANYDATLTQSLREVADALAGQRALVPRLAAEREALAKAESAYDAAKRRYEAGLSNRIELLSAEDQLIPRRQAVAESEARALTLDVALVKALGGGFTEKR